MKNKMVRGLVMTGMVGMLLTACGSKEQADMVQNADTVVTTETTDATAETEADTVIEPATEIKEESTAKGETVTLTSEDFVVNILDDGTAMLTQYSGDAESVVIPSEVDGMTVTVIGEDAFANHDELQFVEIPDTVIEIRNNAFINCLNLREIKMSQKIEIIGDKVFTSLNEIQLPDTLKKLGDSAFSSCNFTNIFIPNNVEEIGVFAFGNTNIEEVVIPGKIKVISRETFDLCKKLKMVVIEDGVETIEENAFAECDILESVTIPASVTQMTDPFWRSENVTIYTPAGSYAETWAAENGVPCVTQ